VAASVTAPTHRRKRRSFLSRNAPVLLAYLAFLILMSLYIGLLPRFSAAQGISIANQGMTLAIAALGQTIVILTGGVDLSVGPVIALTNSIAATLMTDNPARYGGLEGFGLEITDRIPIEMEPNESNEKVLRARKEKLGHLLTKV